MGNYFFRIPRQINNDNHFVRLLIAADTQQWHLYRFFFTSIRGTFSRVFSSSTFRHNLQFEHSEIYAGIRFTNPRPLSIQ